MEASSVTLPAGGREGAGPLPAAFERLFRGEYARVVGIAQRVLGGAARTPLFGSLLCRDRPSARRPRVQRWHAAATRGRRLPEGNEMNDDEIEKALATGDWGVDTESALARFRQRAERERVVP